MPEKTSHDKLRRSSYVRLAVGGFVLIVLSVVVAFAAGNATGAFAAIPPLVLLAIVSGVLLATGRGLVAALVVSVLAVLAYVVFEILSGLFLLRHLDSFADFVPSLMRVVGALIAFFGTLTALRQRRRNALRPARPPERLTLRAGTAGLVVVIALSAVLTYTGNADVDAPPGAFVVETLADEFEPERIVADAGKTLRVFVRNTDSYAHTFTIDELAVDQYIGPGSERIVNVRIPQRAGRWALTCEVTGHESMTGTLIASG